LARSEQTCKQAGAGLGAIGAERNLISIIASLKDALRRHKPAPITNTNLSKIAQSERVVTICRLGFEPVG
jgi:hypothetical protein